MTEFATSHACALTKRESRSRTLCREFQGLILFPRLEPQVTLAGLNDVVKGPCYRPKSREEQEMRVTLVPPYIGHQQTKEDSWKCQQG